MEAVCILLLRFFFARGREVSKQCNSGIVLTQPGGDKHRNVLCGCVVDRDRHAVYLLNKYIAKAGFILRLRHSP